ncbi:MAG: YebC/PmpR family DNA-binding transcriptional regulator [Dehalococcoidales bacterium]|jgi:YebC/PmpR family DNA-binding regulatory protein|nr:YebC/PmpR family DNA-binding transcriptional regulator [Dehalococcoidales bacterium]MDD5604958.1 YebC/PmpR family DNA-binding transcriptional regulator [Dehalococcoidales bacterium]MDX9986275.1 YebC/PmpR family DNA-binding transcriptional regulator [Dehalococcoidales bacterium]
MSGHSKWHSIKHQKGVADVRRGKLFTKLTREIIMASREKGSDPDLNARLRLAIQKAKDANMPSENIQRAIKRGEGSLEGANYIETTFEGYGPGGAAIMISVQTDNRNRTVQEIRSAFSKSGGNLGENGSVAWLFDPKGIISIDTEDVDPDEITLKAIDIGAEDVIVGEGYIEIYTRPEDMEELRQSFEAADITISSADVSQVAKTTLSLDEPTQLQVLRLLDRLEDLDDVQSVVSNVDFDDAVIEQYRST